MKKVLTTRNNNDNIQVTPYGNTYKGEVITTKINIIALKEVMEREGIGTTSQLAQKININRTTAWRILAGKRTKPSPEFLEGVKKGFPTYPLDYFLSCS